MAHENDGRHIVCVCAMCALVSATTLSNWAAFYCCVFSMCMHIKQKNSIVTYPSVLLQTSSIRIARSGLDACVMHFSTTLLQKIIRI